MVENLHSFFESIKAFGYSKDGFRYEDPLVYFKAPKEKKIEIAETCLEYIQKEKSCCLTGALKDGDYFGEMCSTCKLQAVILLHYFLRLKSKKSDFGEKSDSK